MSEKSYSVNDILDEMRLPVYKCQTDETVNELMRDFAERIDEAHKREVAVLKERMSDARRFLEHAMSCISSGVCSAGIDFAKSEAETVICELSKDDGELTICQWKNGEWRKTGGMFDDLVVEAFRKLWDENRKLKGDLINEEH